MRVSESVNRVSARCGEEGNLLSSIFQRSERSAQVTFKGSKLSKER
jgi:hypothetical protein